MYPVSGRGGSRWFLKMFLCLLFLPGFAGMAEKNVVTPLPLWPEGSVPGAKGDGEGHTPILDLWLPLPEKATGAAIVVCPGGGYAHLALDHEGKDIGAWLRDEGIAAFVLHYRHAPDYRHPIPITDARRALRMVRAGAETWGIDPDRIGILGFSAGGHLAASASIHPDPGDSGADDPVERVSSRPDFMVLLYPVISFSEWYKHLGSRQNLLGKDADPELIDRFSLEKHVKEDTPPAFIVSTSEDRAVPSENSVYLYLALHKKNVPAELHVYERGRHGLGLGPGDPAFSTWPEHCIAWLKVRGVLP
jgi:acetyl esterase/lipase